MEGVKEKRKKKKKREENFHLLGTGRADNRRKGGEVRQGREEGVLLKTEKTDRFLSLSFSLSFFLFVLFFSEFLFFFFKLVFLIIFCFFVVVGLKLITEETHFCLIFRV